MAGVKEDEQYFLCKIVDSLSEEQRRSIVAYCYNQMSVEEIAKTYCMTEEEVRRSLGKTLREIDRLRGNREENAALPLLSAELFFAFGEEAQEVAENHLKKNKKIL